LVFFVIDVEVEIPKFGILAPPLARESAVATVTHLKPVLEYY
jgi:hypothetical protein